MKRVDDFRLRLGKHELVPIMIGGMGVDTVPYKHLPAPENVLNLVCRLLL